MATVEKNVLFATKTSSGDLQIVYPATRTECVDGLDEELSNKLDVTGNAASADKLKTPKNIGISGGAIGTPQPFDGLYNVSIPITSIKEAYLDWGGQSLSGNVSPVGASLSSEHSANRLAYINPNAVYAESSEDGGITWTEVPCSDTDKINLCTGSSNNFKCGNATETTIDHRLRITLAGTDGVNRYIYTNPKKLLINMSSPHSQKVIIETKTGKPDAVWKKYGEYTLVGQSGWNDIPLVLNTFGGALSQIDNVWYIRLTFEITKISANWKQSSLSVRSLRLFGMNSWFVESNLGTTGHLYSYDYLQNATFPAYVRALTAPEGTDNTVLATTSFVQRAVKAGVYKHPDNHPATMITEDATHRFVSDTEKSTWNNKADGNHNHDSVYSKTDHTHDYSNVYAPIAHSNNADIHVTSTDKTNWNGKANGNHNHDGVYAKTGHTHDYSNVYAPKSHGHAEYLNSTHNTQANAHNDIRGLITGLTNRLNALSDSDDTTLDQLSEIVAYIKANKGLIDGITTSKVNVTDIINDLVTNVTNKPLSATQGVELKRLVDTKSDAGHNHDDKYQSKGNYAASTHTHTEYVPNESFEQLGNFLKLGKTIPDWNEATTNGIYVAINGRNAPNTTEWFVGVTLALYENYFVQIAYNVASDLSSRKWYQRANNGNNWSDWQEIDYASKEQIIPTTLYASGWSNKQYSFEGSYPSSKYNITVEPSDQCNATQFDAWCSAKILGSATTNIVKALGDVPTVDIPIFIKAVIK